MTNNDKLKIKAESILSKNSARLSENLKSLEVDEILHEIDVYHAELEAQNEELLEKEAHLKESLILNQLIFDEAPFPYFCLDETFHIVNTNIMANSLFSMPMISQKYNTFYRYIAKGSLGLFMDWFQKREYEEKPLEIDLISHNQVRKFRIFLKKLDTKEGLYLINLLDIHEEYFLKKESEENNKILYEIAQYQSDMLAIFDENSDLKFVNNSFLKFYDVISKENFIEKFGSVCSTFLKIDNFFHTNGKKDKHWLKKIDKLDDSKRAVYIYDKKSSSQKTFMVNIAKTLLDDYICTFSEITNFSLQKEEFRKKSYRDELTQIYNRAKFNDFLEHEFLYFTRGKISLVMIMFDIDFFKKVNDNYGHDVGDKVLIEICALANKYVRKSDIFARWGGEEFSILLKGCSLEQGYGLAEIIRQKIEKHYFTSKQLKITCSFGVTEALNGDSIDSFSKRADTLLYKAKDSGRNCVKC